MATRGHYIFNNKTIVYNHWDNYPEGASVLLNNMLLNRRGQEWASSFIRANPSAEITNGEFYGGAEYNYYIDTTTETIRVVTVTWDDEKEQEIESDFYTGSIYDFVNKYFPKSCEVGKQPQYKQDNFIRINTWVNGESIEFLKRKLAEQLDDFSTYCAYSKDNPNRSTKAIQPIIEKMLTLLD